MGIGNDNKEALNQLRIAWPRLPRVKDREFAQSLCNQYAYRTRLSEKQWPWVHRLLKKALEHIEPEPVQVPAPPLQIIVRTPRRKIRIG